jgi:enoyl-CoA hydratase
MGLNEVAIGITPPAFAIELARSRLHPAWLNRTVTLGEMFEPKDAVTAGFVDRIVPASEMESAIEATIASLKALHLPSHAAAKKRLRQPAIAAIRAAIDTDLTPAAYAARALAPSSVVLPTAKASEAA